MVPITAAKAIIEELQEKLAKEMKEEFSSPEFIERLYKHKKDHAFQTVHRQIGRFLSENQEKLGIEKTQRKENLNVFGNETEVQYWKKK